MVSVASSIIFFSVTTIAYFIIKYLLADRFNARNQGIAMACTVVYLATIVAIQTYINVQNAKERCGGTPQTLRAMYYTFVPYLFIFGTLILVLMFFPGFKEPFSNTFGYLAISMWVRKAVNEVLVGDSEKSNSLLKKICQDESILVNLLTPSEKGFTERLENLTKDSDGLRTDWKGTKGEATLYNLVVIKDMVGEFFWIILGLAITVSTTFNGITAIENCAKDGSLMEDALRAGAKKATQSKLLQSIS